MNREEGWSGEENDEISPETYNFLMESEMKTIMECKRRLEETLENAINTYPEEKLIHGWFMKINVFNRNIGESSRIKDEDEDEKEVHIENMFGEDDNEDEMDRECGDGMKLMTGWSVENKKLMMRWKECLEIGWKQSMEVKRVWKSRN